MHPILVPSPVSPGLQTAASYWYSDCPFARVVTQSEQQTGGQDDLVTVYSPWERRVVARCQGHSSFITSAAFDESRCNGRTYRFGSVGEDCRLILVSRIEQQTPPYGKLIRFDSGISHLPPYTAQNILTHILTLNLPPWATPIKIPSHPPLALSYEAGVKFKTHLLSIFLYCGTQRKGVTRGSLNTTQPLPGGTLL